MPCADFRLRDDALDPLALVKVLAVMCHPADVRGREVMLRRHPSHITILRHRPGQPATVDGFAEALWADFAAHQIRGCLAGAYCLALAQLSALGRSGEMAAVLSLAVELTNKWEQALGLERDIPPIAGPAPRKEQQIIGAFVHYRGVSHFWAAAVYGRIQHHEDFVPRRLQAIPRFVAYATEIARLATSLHWATPRPELELPAASLWQFLLPAALTRKAEAEVHRAAAPAAVQNVPSPSAEPLDAQT